MQLVQTPNSLIRTGPFLRKIWPWISVMAMAELCILVINSILGLIYKKFVWSFRPEVHISSLVLVGFILGTIRILNKRLDERFPWADHLGQRLLIQFASNLGISLGFTLLIRNFILLISSPFTDGSRFVRLQDEMIVASVVAFFTLLVVLVDLGIFLMEQWINSATEAERVKQENLEFRFDRLKNQVNPHFLFNSLNTLASLVYNDPDTAASFIRQMAKVYRYVLENRDKEVITLEEEMRFLEAYLYLVKIRFDEGIRFEVTIPPATLQLFLPPMSLQLLIENALKHNIVSASKPLSVRIAATSEWLEVSNNLQPKLSPEPSTKTGLENIRSRYSFLSQRPVQIEPTATSFTVRIPLLPNDQLHV